MHLGLHHIVRLLVGSRTWYPCLEFRLLPLQTLAIPMYTCRCVYICVRIQAYVYVDACVDLHVASNAHVYSSCNIFALLSMCAIYQC